MKKPVLNDSILFDVWAWKDYAGLQPLFDELWMEISKDKCKKKTLKRMKPVLKLYLCNLFNAHCRNVPVAISFKNEMYSHGRYETLHFKRIPFRRVLEFLKEKGLVCEKKGVKFFEKKEETVYNTTGFLTRIWPSDTLTQRFNLLNVITNTESKPIILREDKSDIPYQDTPYTKRLTSHINQINTFYKSHEFKYKNTFTKVEVLNPYYHQYKVKNEWSRFLALMKKDKNKLLIPCYRDMAPYDLPEELSMLQSQDMGKIGFIQDLLHGIKKMSDVSQNNANTFSEIPVELGVENYELHDELEAKSKEIEGLENEKISQYGLQDYVTNFFSNIKKGKTALSAKDHKVTAHFFQQAQKDYDLLINKYRKSEEEERIKKEEKSKIEIVCPHCHQEYKVSESDLQQEIECAMCCRKFTITQTKYCSSCGTPNPMQAFSCWSCQASFYMTKPIPEKEKIPEPIQRFSSADSLGIGYKIAFFIYSFCILVGYKSDKSDSSLLQSIFGIVILLYVLCSWKVFCLSHMITKSYRKIFWTTFRKISIGMVLIIQILLLLLSPFSFFAFREDFNFLASVILTVFVFSYYLFTTFMTIKFIQLFNLRAKEDVDFVEDKTFIAFIAEHNNKIIIKFCLITGICLISCIVLCIIWKMLSS
ncbi:MAG: hypothetical protein BWY31_03911 [Lentisphaerae bacterium ADurb.Bin242]|nr:MAG: hypothetical protein BWY31_03911 [Lentisphaerae bacterium ADurb.Bin242]